jgi:hypothetical protein
MKVLVLAALAALVSACGGGGSGPSGAASPAVSAEGIWNGSASTGSTVSLVVLESGETWGIYSNSNLVTGALYGNTASSGTTLSGSGKDFNIPTRSITTASYSGTFAAKNNIRVISSNGSSFNGTYSTAYDQPASLAALQGTFVGQGVSGNSTAQPTQVSISASGAITTPASSACNAAGSVAPRASGKNIFDLSVTFTGPNCALGNGTVTNGIGYYDITSRKLSVLALNPAKSDGFIYIGQK